MGTRVAGAAWRVCVAALVVALPIAATASAGAVTATSPSPAPTAASCYTPALFAYDAASYVYDGPARLSSPDTVATDARSSPSRPEVGSWEGAASVRDRGVAANTAASTADDWANVSGVLRDASRGKGNFGVGTGTAAEAQTAGRAWVGDGARLASDGKTWLSQDGLRQWKPPSFKPGWQGGTWQSNFESRWVPSGQWQTNGHLDITDLP